MSEYHFVSPGDIIREGDEYMHADHPSSGWTPVPRFKIGEKAPHNDDITIRRQLSEGGE